MASLRRTPGLAFSSTERVLLLEATTLAKLFVTLAIVSPGAGVVLAHAHMPAHARETEILAQKRDTNAFAVDSHRLLQRRRRRPVRRVRWSGMFNNDRNSTPGTAMTLEESRQSGCSESLRVDASTGGALIISIPELIV